jgi:hypothetical protein
MLDATASRRILAAGIILAVFDAACLVWWLR